MGKVAVASLRQQQVVVFVLQLLSRQSLLLAWFSSIMANRIL